jgi:hypothetical protein
MLFENAINIQGRVQGTFAAGSQSAKKLTPGVYAVWASAAMHIKVDSVLASDVTSATGYLLRADTTVNVRIASDSFLGAAGTGNVYYQQIA